MKKVKATKLLSREDWLARSLEVIARKGGRFRIEELARELGVTKGSFYWHFKDREDFVRSVARYWKDYFTIRVIREVEKTKGDAKDRLFAVMDMVTREDLPVYNLAVLSWAAYEPAVAAVVREVYKSQHAYVRSLFAEMGFTGEDLEMRTRTFIAYLNTSRMVILPHEPMKDCLRKLRERFAFFVRP
jgi:AcrR family transcriptional regulator